MKDIRSQRQIEEMRARLYARSAPTTSTRATLSDTPIAVATDWQTAEVSKPQVEDVRQGITTPVSTLPSEESSAPAPTAPRRSYRWIMAGVTFVLFILMAGVSATYLFFGGNQISANNIGISLSAPTTIGGGEVLPLQFGITNQNSVPIESVVLIVTYPPGAQSTDDTPRRLTEERLTLDPLGPGEVRNIPIKAVLFGEENQEQTITATLEYRIANSNGLFYKEVSPSIVRISSSPLLLTASAIERVASGQQVTITVTARSNASNPLTNVLITGEFPTGFIVTESSLPPVSGKNVWNIDSIPPEGEVTFTVTGLVEGLTDESMRTRFVSGLSQPSDWLAMVSTLATANADFVVERPFIRVTPKIGNSTDQNTVLPFGESTTVTIEIQNTLTESVYDMWVKVTPTGNVVSPELIKSSGGFYDSNSGTIRWDSAGNARFSVIDPGGTRTISFNVKPNNQRTNATLQFTVDVYARRIVDNQSIEQLVGVAERSVKYSSDASFGSQVERNTAFTDTGFVPPRVGSATTYTVTLVAEAGFNAVSNARVTASLPTYVDWLDTIQGDGRIVFNSISKQLEWVIGDIVARDKATVSFQVSVLPSLSQVGRAITLIDKQTLQAQDAFTGAQLRSSAGAKTTELSTEAGFPEGNGKVRTAN